MKKIIGVLGIAVFAMVMFFNTDSLNNSNADLDLSSLMAINKANAEETEWFADEEEQECEMLVYSHTEQQSTPNGGFIIVDIYVTVQGNETICTGWWGFCDAVACS